MYKLWACGMSCLALAGCVPDPGASVGAPYAASPSLAYSGGPVYGAPVYPYGGAVGVAGPAFGLGYGGYSGYRRDDLARSRFDRQRYDRQDFGRQDLGRQNYERQNFDRQRSDRERGERDRNAYQRDRLAHPEQRPPPFAGSRPPVTGGPFPNPQFGGARPQPPQAPPQGSPQGRPQGGLLGRPFRDPS